ncbi:MAG: hypothetical protein JW797_04185 [Bradymonadales bacterium]|nr:hypothetical protein [Bradymonadales bacterium]
MLGASLSADNPDTYDQEWVNTQGFDLLTEPWAIGLGVGGLVLGGTLGALLCDTTDRRDQFILVHSFILLAQGALLLSGWNQQTEYGAFEDADAMFFIGSVPWLVMEVGVMALFLALVRDTPTSEEEGSNEGSLWIEMAPASLTIRF